MSSAERQIWRATYRHVGDGSGRPGGRERCPRPTVSARVPSACPLLGSGHRTTGGRRLFARCSVDVVVLALERVRMSSQSATGSPLGRLRLVIGVLVALMLTSLGPSIRSQGPWAVPSATAAECSWSGSGPANAWSADGSTEGSPGPALEGPVVFGTGRAGSGFVLSGSGLSSMAVPTVSSGVSVMAWIRPSDPMRVQTVMSRSTGPSFTDSSDVSHGFALRIGLPWGVEWEVDDPSSMVPEVLRPQVFAALDDDRWHHVAASWEPGSMAVFIDGAEVARQDSRSASINPAAATPFMIGGEHRTPFGFVGLIDDVQLFDRAISASEIAACVAAPTPRTISTVAGIGTPGFSGDGVPAVDSRLFPADVATDAAGNLYIADYNSRVRIVTPAGVISTIAGTGIPGSSGDGGPATAARLHTPTGLAFDADGNLYIADANDHRVRKITPAGIISTVAGTGTPGSGGDGGPATEAQLSTPLRVAVDSHGNLYVTELNGHRVRKVTSAGVISTIAGTGEPGFSGDGGPAHQAQVWAVTGVAVDASGNVYIADHGNNRIRMIATSGVITTVAGNGWLGSAGDGGPATAAPMWSPYGLAIGPAGDLYITSYSALQGHVVRRVSRAGMISTVAGAGVEGFSGDGGPAVGAGLSNPRGVVVDGQGNLFIADTGNYRIRKVDD